MGESATCDADCTAVSCGDSVTNVSAGEACDSGGVDSAGCDFDCSSVSCGDGYVNSAAGEVCDDAGAGGCAPDCSAVLQTATIDIYVVGTPRRGWWNSNGSGNGSVGNTYTGEEGGVIYRSWFAWDRSPYAGTTIVSAELHLELESWWNTDGTALVDVWDVTTDFNTISSGPGMVAAFNDLGSGAGRDARTLRTVVAQGPSS